MLWHDLPLPSVGDCLAAFHLLRYLHQKHDVTLLSFKQITEKTRQIEDLAQYCQIIEPMSISEPQLQLKQLLLTIKNMLCPQNLLSKNPSFFDFYYSPKMQTKVRALLTATKFDLIYTSEPMALYVQDSSLPKVVHPFDCFTEYSRQRYTNSKNPWSKFIWWLYYLRTKRYEGNVLKKFDTCIVVNPQEQRTMQSLFPSINIVVVPIGVDAEFFKPLNEAEEWPSLIFVGNMFAPYNIDAVLYFYSQVYQEIRRQLPKLKLYIVGRSPAEEIKRLSSDECVIVTGYVEDVRPYLARACVVIAPFISGTGTKTKVLEAMAMGKPVVSTSIGVRGINVSPGENAIVADKPAEFAQRIIELLLDRRLRQEIGRNGRRLVETSYLWEKAAEQLNDIFEEITRR